MTKSKSEKVKFVDDGTVAVSVNLKSCIIPDSVDRVGFSPGADID